MAQLTGSCPTLTDDKARCKKGEEVQPIDTILKQECLENRIKTVTEEILNPPHTPMTQNPRLDTPIQQKGCNLCYAMTMATPPTPRL